MKFMKILLKFDKNRSFINNCVVRLQCRYAVFRAKLRGTRKSLSFRFDYAFP